MLQLDGMGERKYDTNAERQAAYRERRHKREYDERRARAKDYAATLGDALGWDEERVEEALVRVASHEDGLVAVELALQAFARTKAARRGVRAGPGRRARTMSWFVGFGHEGARDPEMVAAEVAVIDAEL